jgi:hypothetical protein
VPPQEKQPNFNQSKNDEKKKLVTKNQRWEPIYQKCKANENTSRYNPKKKKVNNQQKSGKKPM